MGIRTRTRAICGVVVAISAALSALVLDPLPTSAASPEDVVFTVEPAKKVYAYDEPVTLFFNFTNTAEESITLTYPSTLVVTFSIQRWEGAEVFNSPTYAFWVIIDVVIAPGATRSYNHSWDQVNNLANPNYWTGTQVPVDYYVVSAESVPYGYYYVARNMFAVGNQSAPVAVLSAPADIQDTMVPIEFNASSSSDLFGHSTDLVCRWDWDGDNVWDTDWSTVLNAEHTYDLPGTYQVKVEVKDALGMTAIAEQEITVQSVAVPEMPPLGLALAVGSVGLAVFVFGGRWRKSDGTGRR